MIIIIRCNSIKSDSRTEKYIKYYQLNNFHYKIIGWDRLGDGLLYENAIFFQQRSLFNQGGIKAVYHRLKWMWFVIKTLIKNRNDLTVIHACDLDAAFPSAVFKFLFSDNVKLVFDVFDWFTDTLHRQNKLILFCFRVMERFSIYKSDEVIICENERIHQIPYKLNKKELVLPNIPYFSEINFLFNDEKYFFENNKIVFSYVGGLVCERFLEELLIITEQGLVNLLIAGYGDCNLEKKCEQLSVLPNVKFFGKVDYKTGLNIMFNSDVIYAMYCKSNPNHIYAAPNKFYEAMMLGKPILSTKGISIERKILENDIGYVIDESINELIDQVFSMTREDLVAKGEKAHFIWNTKFSNYTSFFLENSYREIITT